jgi:hypothetical protein
MRRLVFIASFVIAVLLVCGARAQEQPQGTPPSQPDMQKMMQEYLKMGAPVAEHQQLAKLAGEWISHSKMWMGPGAPPTETPPGSHKGEMILGGRFLRFTDTGDMMGMPMEGWGLMGYNKTRGQYEMIWVDNMGTPIYFAAGKADSTGNVITLLGKVDDPMSGKRDQDVKYIYRFPNDSTVIFEMWDSSGPGTFYKSMETAYTKK